MSLHHDPTIAASMTEIDPALRQLLTTEITSFAHWDVLRFFIVEEREQATMDEIALAAGRDIAALISVTGELVSVGWLSRRAAEGETVYVLTQEREHRALLDRLNAMLQERQGRLKAIYYWTRHREW